MFYDKKNCYDFIFSMGEACSCTEALRRGGLQFASYPFDWIAGLTFRERAQIVHDHFDGFLCLPDLKDMGRTNGDPENMCEVYYNTRTNLIHNHDFPAGEKLEDSFPKVAAKFKNRCDRLYHKMAAAERILAVYIEAPIQNHPKISDEDIQKGYDLLAELYPDKRIDLLYLTNRKGNTEFFTLSPYITRLYLDYKRKKAGGSDYSVDTRALARVLRKCYLNGSGAQRRRRLFWRFVAGFIPNKLARRRFQKRHHA